MYNSSYTYYTYTHTYTYRRQLAFRLIRLAFNSGVSVRIESLSSEMKRDRTMKIVTVVFTGLYSEWDVNIWSWNVCAVSIRFILCSIVVESFLILFVSELWKVWQRKRLVVVAVKLTSSPLKREHIHQRRAL